jgi:hypothetical protein
MFIDIYCIFLPGNCFVDCVLLVNGYWLKDKGQRTKVKGKRLKDSWQLADRRKRQVSGTNHLPLTTHNPQAFSLLP